MAPAPSPFSCPPGARPTESVRKLVLSPHPVSVIPRYPFPPPGRRRPAPPDTESPFIFAAARQPGPHRLLSRFRPNRRRIRIPADPRANFQSRDANLTESDPRGVICFRRRADPALPRPAPSRGLEGAWKPYRGGAVRPGQGIARRGSVPPSAAPFGERQSLRSIGGTAATLLNSSFSPRLLALSGFGGARGRGSAPAPLLLCSCSAPPGAGPTPLASPRGPE